MIIITYRPLYCVLALKLGIPSRKFLAPPLPTSRIPQLEHRRVGVDPNIAITHLS